MSPRHLATLLGVVWALFASSIANAAANEAQVTISVTDEVTDSGLTLAMVIDVDVGTDGLTTMQRVVTTEVRRYPGSGVFVESIAGIRAPSGAFWALFVDGEKSTVGIASIVVDQDIVIEWRLERIE